MNRRKVKLVLLSVMAVGAIGSVTVRGVYAALSAEDTNVGGTVSSGTLTMDNFNFGTGSSSPAAAATKLGQKLGKNTLSADVPETTLTAAVTNAQPTITVASATGFPTSGNFTILVDHEQMTVTAEAGTTWTVTRGVNSTTAAAHSSGTPVDPTTITVNSATSFATTLPFQVQVDSEVMTVTAEAGTTWTVTRGANGTAIAPHTTATNDVIQKTVFVNSDSGFPTTGDYTVDMGNEELLVTGGQGTTTWTVDRGVDGTSTPNHAANAAVTSNDCTSYGGTLNVNTACDAVFTWAPDAENYPGTPVTTNVAITDSGSLPVSDLEFYMPSCLRDITPDAPFAATTPSITKFNTAGTTGGFLVGGQTYYYELTAILPSGETVAGPESEYTPPGTTSTNKIKLNWAAISNATGYKVYRSTSEGGEQLLATIASGSTVSYTDSTNTTPSGDPPSGNGSGNPCQPGNAQITIQETNSSGTATKCWYPAGLGTTCSFGSAFDLGILAEFYNKLSAAIDLGSGPAALGTRYFQISLEFPSSATNALQGTAADFTLHWYALS